MWTLKSVGGLLAVALCATLLSVGSAEAAILFWNPATAYTDGSPIEASKIITYNVRVDGAGQGNVPCNPATDGACEWPIPASLAGHNTSHAFELQTTLSTGEVSVWTPPFAWTSPAGTPEAGTGIGVR